MHQYPSARGVISSFEGHHVEHFVRGLFTARPARAAAFPAAAAGSAAARRWLRAVGFSVRAAPPVRTAGGSGEAQVARGGGEV